MEEHQPELKRPPGETIEDLEPDEEDTEAVRGGGIAGESQESQVKSQIEIASM